MIENYFNADYIKENVSNFDNEKLCAIIVSFKYFNNNFDVIQQCMQELASRRSNGDNFQFEEYIQREFNKLPKIENNKIDIRNILNNMSSFIK